MTQDTCQCKRDPVQIVRETCGTPTAKLIAVLAAFGITDAAEVAEVIGISERGVRKARNSRTGTPGPRGTTVPELQGRRGTPVPKTELQGRNSSSALARAYKESPTEILVPKVEDEKDIPNGISQKSTSKGPGRAQALEAFTAYNDTALRCGLPQAAKMTPDRERKLIARLRDYGLPGWHAALKNIEHSAFLTGSNDRGWRASLDFLLQASSFAKCHDGGYGNGRAAPERLTASAYLKQLAAADAGVAQ